MAGKYIQVGLAGPPRVPAFVLRAQFDIPVITGRTFQKVRKTITNNDYTR